jgi:hypothetical protein
MNAQRGFLNCKQHPGQSPAVHRDDLRSWAVTITQKGGSIAANHRLIPAKDQNWNERSEDDRRTRAYDKTFAIALISGANPSKYGTLIAYLSNQYAMGRDEYPSDETAAYNLLVNYRIPENVSRPRYAVAQYNPPGHTPTGQSVGSGITFALQVSVAGNNGLTYEGIECYHYHSVGHYASNCPIDAKVTIGTTLTQFAYMMAQAPNASNIDPRGILIDSQSTISVSATPPC